MNKFLFAALKFLFYPYRKIRIKSRKWRNFYLPNFQVLFSDNISGFKNASFIQRVKLAGIGKINVEDSCKFGYEAGGFINGTGIELQARTIKSKIHIGQNTAFNNNVFVCAANYIGIGNNVLIGQGVTIMDFEAHGIHPLDRREMGPVGSVVIEDNVWIGNNVIILRNTKIGTNSIVAAGAIVKGDFPANVILGGCPARIIKQIPVG